MVLPPLSLEDTLRSANLTDYLALLHASGLLGDIKQMQGITLFVRHTSTHRV